MRQACRKLIAINPDNYKYHHGLCAALQIDLQSSSASDASIARVSAMYTTMQSTFPDSAACRRIPLDFLRGDEFKAALRQHLTRFITKGIPSLFSDIRPLLSDPTRQAVIHDICTSLQVQARLRSHFLFCLFHVGVQCVLHRERRTGKT